MMRKPTDTVHAQPFPGNEKTPCRMRTTKIAAKPFDVTCNICSLRVLRSGQKNKLNLDQIEIWTWDQVYAS